MKHITLFFSFLHRHSAFGIFSLSVSIVVFTSGCTKSDDSHPNNRIHIGALIPVTGAVASTGESAMAALDFAEEDINQYFTSIEGDFRVQFDIRDTEANTVRALEQLTAFHQDGIRHIVGPFTSANAEVVLDFSNTHGITLLSPASVATTLAIPNDHLFRLVPDDHHQAEAIAALWAYDQIDFIIPVVRNEIWGTGLIGEVTPLLTQQGKTVISPIYYDPSAIDVIGIINQLTQVIQQTLQQAPAARTAVYLLSYGEGTSILSAASASPECALIRWYGSSAYATSAGLILDPVAAEFARQQNFSCPIFTPDPAAQDRWAPIITRLSNHLGRLPEVYALTTYDAAWLMALAHRDCPDPRDAAVFNATLMQIAGIYYGITGRTTLNAAGDRKFATIGFWNVSHVNTEYHWNEFGHYSNANGQLVIY